MKINREKFLKSLLAVAPGLARREDIEQSTSFVFSNGFAYTFDDKLSCIAPSLLPEEWTAVVLAKPLMEFLQQIGDEQVNVAITNTKMLVVGKEDKAAFRIDTKITLPIDLIGALAEWYDLPPNFADAVKVVSECGSNDEQRFQLTCIHITADFMEACDNVQVARYTISLGLDSEVLVSHKSLRAVADMKPTQIGVTDNWLSFRNEEVVFSCRRFLDEYPDLSAILDTNGAPFTLPADLGGKLDLANIFSSRDTDDDKVFITLRENLMLIEGQSAVGKYKGRKKVEYSGPDIRFRISPVLLADITSRTPVCEMSETRLKVTGENFVYVSCLSRVEEPIVNTTEE